MTGNFRSNPRRFWSFLNVSDGKVYLPTFPDGTSEASGDVDRLGLLNRTFANNLSDPSLASLPAVPRTCRIRQISECRHPPSNKFQATYR